MKRLEKIKKHIYLAIGCLAILSSISCKTNLDETPFDYLGPDNAYTTPSGFEAGIIGLYANGKGFIESWNGLNEKEWEVLYGQGADIGFHIDKTNWITDYSVVNSTNSTAYAIWKKCYSLVRDANLIINRAENPDINWDSDEQRNNVIGQARFFRAFAYRFLVYLYGGVPIIDYEINTPKYDLVRDSKEDVMAFMLSDLEYASANLTSENKYGSRLSTAAADYLLAETYNTLGRYDDAIAAANRILNDPKYELMYSRFGSMTDKPGDVYWDLYRTGNQNREINKETIFMWTFEYNVEGGGYYPAVERAWGPFWEKLRTPDGMVALVKDDVRGRPVSFIRITDWVEQGMWNDFDNDIRNSEYNVKRDFYINNPASAHYGEMIEKTEANHERFYYPYFQKFTNPHGHVQGYDSQGRNYNDWYVFRVAGVYLLRAEAYLGKNDLTNAAADVNKVRARANAALALESEIDIDYILDERARELIGEEHRRVTLCRLGKLVERTKLYNPVSGATIMEYNALLPIPQKEIDANVGAVLEQNPNY